MISTCPQCAGRGVFEKRYFGRLTLEHCRPCRGTGFIDHVERAKSRRCRLLARAAERLSRRAEG